MNFPTLCSHSLPLYRWLTYTYEQTVRARGAADAEPTGVRGGDGVAGELGAGGEQCAAGDPDAEGAADWVERRGGVWAVSVRDDVEGSGVRGDGGLELLILSNGAWMTVSMA